MAKKFDLNIEKVLEDWEVFHAVREIIANALDETELSGAADIQIYKDNSDRWHIRDFGGGLRYSHLTQKENDEKVRSAKLIGKFGVGLKDALATFDRRGVGLEIYSPHGDITLEKAEKHGFADIITLHAAVHSPSHFDLVGTDFVLSHLSDEDMEMAKNMFLKFSGDQLLEDTQYGQVLVKASPQSIIYITGVKVAEEENFLFSYNITSLSSAIKKALNRERTNVGRTAYTERVKAILLACHSPAVAENLVADLGNFQKGLMKDELKWTDVYVHACKLLNAQKKVIFLTPNERGYAAGIVSHARHDGYKIITIPDNIRDKLKGQTDYQGNPIRDLNEFLRMWNDSFEFEFVSPSELTNKEKIVWSHAKQIMDLIGGKPEGVRSVRISESMRLSKSSVEVVGVWEPDVGRIVIKRSQLANLADFAGTLLHELAHATTDAPDVSEVFERELTAFLGLVAKKGLGPRLAKNALASGRAKNALASGRAKNALASGRAKNGLASGRAKNGLASGRAKKAKRRAS